jgi:hypothetical protein
MEYWVDACEKELSLLRLRKLAGDETFMFVKTVAKNAE